MTIRSAQPAIIPADGMVPGRLCAAPPRADRGGPALRCVHCGAKLLGADQACPVCRDPSPRRFQAGPSHVEILELRAPRRVLRWLQGRYLPTADAATSRVLARQLAAVCLGPVRVLSFVDRRQAEQLQRDLRRAGAQARVIDEPVWPWGVIAVFLLALLGVTLVLDRAGAYVLAYTLYFVSEPLLSVLRARQSLLSPSRWPRSAWPGLQLRCALLSLILLCIADSLVARGIDRLAFDGAFHALTAGLAGVALLATAFGVGRIRALRSPEPALVEQLQAAWLWGRQWQRGQPLHQARRLAPTRPLVRVLAIALAVCLIPVETALLLRGSAQLRDLGAHVERPAAHDPGTVVSAVSLEDAPAAPALVSRTLAGPFFAALPLLVLAGLGLVAIARSRRLGHQGSLLGSDRPRSTRAAPRAPPWSVVLEHVDDQDLIQAWLLSEHAPRLRVSRASLPARLRQWPVTLVCGISQAHALALAGDARSHGASARALYGWHSTAQRRLRDASPVELGLAAGLHTAAALGLGGLLLAAGTRLQHLLLIPPLLVLIGLVAVRQLPRRSLLRPGP
ncbi:MAG: hypothetical protein ABIJ09_17295 [Pseudomonadota bacterium]